MPKTFSFVQFNNVDIKPQDSRSQQSKTKKWDSVPRAALKKLYEAAPVWQIHVNGWRSNLNAKSTDQPWSELVAGLFQLQDLSDVAHGIPRSVIKRAVEMLGKENLSFLYPFLWKNLLLYCRGLIKQQLHSQEDIVELLRPVSPEIGAKYLTQLHHGAYLFQKYVINQLIAFKWPVYVAHLLVFYCEFLSTSAERY